MDEKMIWHILGIDPTDDTDALKQRYHALLTSVNPEDDPEGFKRLREAYEEAVRLATESGEDEEEKEKDEYDLWIEEADGIYSYLDTRNNLERWKKYFDNPICIALDTSLEARERFLIFLMQHNYFEQKIWQLFDKVFDIRADKEALEEKFPCDYLDYVEYQIENENFFRYEWLSVRALDDSEAEIDTYISSLLRIKGLFDHDQFENGEQLIEDLHAYQVYHPYEDVELMRFYIHEKRTDKTIPIADKLIEKYPDDTYILFMAGDAYDQAENHAKARECVDRVLEIMPNHYSARAELARMCLEEEPLRAKDLISDLLEENGRDEMVLDLMQKVNEPLIRYYCEKAEEEPERRKEHMVEACWCMFQNERFNEAIDELDALGIEEGDEEYYDYVNMLGRCYMGLEEYSMALPYLQKWEICRENLVDDGTEKYKKRRSRAGFIHSAIGFAYLKLEDYEQAEKYLKEGIRLETDPINKFSFMDRLAFLYQQQERFEECIDICSDIIDDEPGYFPAYLRRQNAFFELQNGQGVVDDYYNAVRIYAGYYRPYLLAVRVFYSYRQYEDARRVLEAAKEQGVEHEMLDFYALRIGRNVAETKEDYEELANGFNALREKLKNKKTEQIREGEKTDEEILDDELKKNGEPLDEVDEEELDIEEALVSMDRHCYEDALALIESWLSVKPEDNRLNWIRADILRSLKRYDEAINAYSDLEPKMPDNADVIFSKALCLRDIGQVMEALTQFKRVKKKAPRHPQVNHEIMKIYSRIYDRFELKYAYDHAIKAITDQIANVQDPYYYIERGLMYMDGFNTRQAVADYEKALEMEPDNMYAYNNIGFVYHVSGRYEEAVDYLKKAIELRGEERTLLPYTNLARTYQAMRRPKDGIRVLEELHASGEGALSTYTRLAELYSTIGDFDRAIAAYDEAKQKELMSPEDHRKRVLHTRILRGEVAEVTKEHQRILKAFKDAPELFYYNGKKIRDPKKVDRQKARNFADAAEDYGRFLLYSRNLKESIKVFENLVSLAGYLDVVNLPEVECMLALAYRLAGNRKKAIETGTNALYHVLRNPEIPEGLRKHEKIDPYTVDAYLSHKPYAPYRHKEIALIYACLGDMEKAAGYLNHAPELLRCRHCAFDTCYDVLEAWGYFYEIAGDPEKAKKFFQMAYDVNPSDYENILNVWNYAPKKRP